MEDRSRAEIDFDAWSQLARSDPQAFEAMRLAAIEAAIARAPEANRERLRRLQWRIDQERRLARTPMAACLRISRLMWRSVLGPGGLQERLGELQALFRGQGGEADRRGPSPAGARVVALVRSTD